MSSISDCTRLNDVANSPNLCTGELEYDYYGYTPALGACLAFTILFGLSTLAHLVQGIKGRRWFMLFTMTLCGLGETIGWAGRLWSNRSAEWNPAFGGFIYSNRTAFMQEIAALIISPAFWAAGAYITLGKLIKLNENYCRFNPLTYAIVFVSGDVISLVIQAIGGGAAAAADTPEGADNGAHVMVAGVLCQMAVMVGYTLVLVEYIYRYFAKRPVSRQFRIRKSKRTATGARSVPLTPAEDKKVKLTIAALVTSTVLIFIRSIYRVIELLDGWNGSIIENEALFNVLDALAVLLALLCFNFIHPMWFLPRPEELEHSSASSSTYAMEKVNSQQQLTDSGDHL